MTELERAEISARIKVARKTAGLTQDELGDLLGVQQRSIANYESVRVPWRYITQIAEATGRTTEWLLHGDKDEASEQGADGEVLARLAAVESLLQDVLRRLPAAPDEQVEASEG